jgi:regulator of extracellular matrix RemA (YlzA/DUF370 family)
MIILGRGGAVDADRVVAIAPFKSKPVKRLLDAAGSGMVLNMTYGYSCHSVILLDNGYLVVSSRTMEELARVFHDTSKEDPDNDRQPPWW